MWLLSLVGMASPVLRNVIFIFSMIILGKRRLLKFAKRQNSTRFSSEWEKKNLNRDLFNEIYE